MLTLFIDISDLRSLFLTTPAPLTGQENVLTEHDFKVWIFEAVNFLNLIYTDFGLATDKIQYKLSSPAVNFEGMKELYESLREALNHELLKNSAILSSYGYIHGDLLYFQLEVENDN